MQRGALQKTRNTPRISRFDVNTPARAGKTKNKSGATYEQPCVEANRTSSLIADEGSKRLADIVVDHQIGDVVLIRGFVVDNHKLGPAIAGQ